MATTSNEQIYDALIRRQVYVVRFSNQLSAEAVKLLKATDTELEKLVLYYSRKLRGKSLTSKPARKLLKAMQSEVTALRYSAWDGVSKGLDAELKAYAAKEAEYVSKVIREALPVIVNTTPVPAAKIAEVIKHTAWEGATLSEHINTAAAADVSRIVKRVRIGVGRQQSLDEIVRNVMGSALQQYRDGAVSKAWSGAETLAYSATTSAQTEATTLVAEENPWLITQEIYRATLDGRTTPICIKNSNKVFDIGKGPMPPLHYKCRSRRVPLISDDSLGPQPFDPSTERTLATEYAQINGLGKVRSRAALPYGTKGDFDAWARKRRRELIGQVPDEVSYPAWFKQQSAAFQDEELGPTRGKIYRSNDLPLDKYINRKGQYYTIAQLDAKSGTP